MARRTGIFELTFKQNIPGFLGQRGEDLACARDELMEFECQESARSRASSLRFRQTDAG